MIKNLLLILTMLICCKSSHCKDAYFLKGKVYFHDHLMCNDSFVISNTTFYSLVHTNDSGEYIAKIPIFHIFKYVNKLDSSTIRYVTANSPLLNIYKNTYNYDTINFWQDFTYLGKSINTTDTTYLNIYFTSKKSVEISENLLYEIPPKLSKKYENKLLKTKDSKRASFISKNARYLNYKDMSLEKLRTLLGSSITSDTLKYEVVHPDLIYVELLRNDKGIDKRLEILFKLQNNYVKDWSSAEFWTEMRNDIPNDITFVIKQFLIPDRSMTFEVVR